MSISDHILVCYSNPMGETCFKNYFSVTECWTGFTGDAVNFCLFVTDKKIIKAEALIIELSGLSGHVAIRTVTGLVGLLVSFYLAMGPISQFHGRGLIMFVAGHVQSLGWNGWAVLDGQSWTELCFWNDNIQRG